MPGGPPNPGLLAGPGSIRHSLRPRPAGPGCGHVRDSRPRPRRIPDANRVPRPQAGRYRHAHQSRGKRSGLLGVQADATSGPAASCPWPHEPRCRPWRFTLPAIRSLGIIVASWLQQEPSSRGSRMLEGWHDHGEDHDYDQDRNQYSRPAWAARRSRSAPKRIANGPKKTTGAMSSGRGSTCTQPLSSKTRLAAGALRLLPDDPNDPAEIDGEQSNHHHQRSNGQRSAWWFH